MAKTCMNHRDRPASTMCHQCHKPICRSCVVVTPTGSFCSSECSVSFRLIKTKLGGGKKKETSMTGKMVLLVGSSIILLVMLVHFAAGRMEALQKFDFLGKILGKYEQQEAPR